MRFNTWEINLFEIMLYRFGVGFNLFIFEDNYSEWITFGIWLDKDGIYTVLFNKQYSIDYESKS